MNQPSTKVQRGRIVVVDDDELFQGTLRANLAEAGYATEPFLDGRAALDHLLGGSGADLVLLDWKMPAMTGIEVLEQLRQHKIDIPVIFLTVLTDQVYEEAGLHSGAVDFVEKTRSFSILQKRIELILSAHKVHAKRQSQNKPDVVDVGDLTLRFESCRAAWKGTDLALTLTEFNIIALLVENAPRDVSYREIYDIVHSEGFIAGDGNTGYRTNVRAFVKRIRQKFREIDADFSAIENYAGFGYRWKAD